MIGNEKLRDIARSLGARPQGPVALDMDRARKIAAEFERMEHAPDNLYVQRAYGCMIVETMRQYRAVKALGLVIEPMPVLNAYRQSADLFRDVARGHLYYFPTSRGFGAPGEIRKDSPMLARIAGESLDHGRPLLFNDIFRIVHDLFGHCKEGYSFGKIGEENAFAQHASLYSGHALRALTTETRGQNCWVNFGPHAAHNAENPFDTIYADQKTGLLPEWCSEL